MTVRRMLGVAGFVRGAVSVGALVAAVGAGLAVAGGGAVGVGPRAARVVAAGPAEKSDAAAVAMLGRAEAMENLKAEDGAAFTLQAAVEMDFGEKKAPGTYELTWWGPEKWHEDLKLGSFKRVRDGVAGGYWQKRSMDYQPREIFDVDRVLDVAELVRLGPNEVARKIERRKFGKVQLACVGVYAYEYEARELCFDEASGMLIRASNAPLGGPFGAPYVVDYAGRITVGARQFPSVGRLTLGDKFAVTITIGKLVASSGGAVATTATTFPGAEFWPRCKGAGEPELIHSVDPKYPDYARVMHITGVVSFYAVVEGDGTVTHLTTLDAPSKALEESAREAVKKWKYSAPVCGGVGAKTETLIDVAFNQYVN